MHHWKQHFSCMPCDDHRFVLKGTQSPSLIRKLLQCKESSTVHLWPWLRLWISVGLFTGGSVVWSPNPFDVFSLISSWCLKRFVLWPFRCNLFQGTSLGKIWGQRYQCHNTSLWGFENQIICWTVQHQISVWIWSSILWLLFWLPIWLYQGCWAI